VRLGSWTRCWVLREHTLPRRCGGAVPVSGGRGFRPGPHHTKPLQQVLPVPGGGCWGLVVGLVWGLVVV